MYCFCFENSKKCRGIEQLKWLNVIVYALHI